MPHAYIENQLVEQPAKRLLSELGWSLAQPHSHPDPLPAGEGVWVEKTGLFRRETKGEVVLVSRLRAALERLNAGRMGHHARPRNYFGCSLGDYVTLPTSLKLNPYNLTKI